VVHRDLFAGVLRAFLCYTMVAFSIRFIGIENVQAQEGWYGRVFVETIYIRQTSKAIYQLILTVCGSAIVNDKSSDVDVV